MRHPARRLPTSARDGHVIAQVAEGDDEDIDRTVRVSRLAFEDGRWSRIAPVERKRIMLRFADLVRARPLDLALLETLDVGKPISDWINVDVRLCADNLQWLAECIDKSYGELAPVANDSIAMITREPMGVIGCVVPWNHPLIITSWKIGAALASGTSVVLKPAEQSPLSALLLAALSCVMRPTATQSRCRWSSAASRRRSCWQMWPISALRHRSLPGVCSTTLARRAMPERG